MRISTVTFREGLPLMDSTPAGIESEMLDLSTVGISQLTSMNGSGITAAITRVRHRIADPDGNISGYSVSFASRAAPAGPQAEDLLG
ncbi:hypothetical protein ACN27J_05795 [Solwaraspora sp. WMMB762]|uniref:hypothetical protein n=1 Tax=Solwaraspora sp. WMMB762 TaxID=3404120 RepID=UPI003B932CFF